MYTSFVPIVRLFRTYRASFFRTLCSFCVRKQLIFTVFNAESLEGSNLDGSLVSFFFVNAHDLWKVSRDTILRVPSIYFVCASCSWLLDTLDDPILIVLSISLSARSAHDSPSKFLGGFFVSLDRSILPGGLILLCTMLLCGSYISVWYLGYFGYNYDIVD